MTVRTRFQRTAVVLVLVLGLLVAPAVPTHADEVGSSWTQGVADWVRTWITVWQTPAKTHVDKDFQKRVSDARQVIGPAPDPDEGDDFTNFDLLETVPSTHEGQSCEAYPELDPVGNC